MKHLRSDREHMFKEIVNNKLQDQDAQRAIDEQIQLLSDDEVSLY